MGHGNIDVLVLAYSKTWEEVGGRLCGRKGPALHQTQCLLTQRNPLQGKLSKPESESPQRKPRKADDGVSTSELTTHLQLTKRWHNDDVTPNDITDDMSPEYLDELKNSFYTMNVTLTIEQADKLEQETQEQSGSDMWIRNEAHDCFTSWWHTEDEEDN